jgi:hypothetical protein
VALRPRLSPGVPMERRWGLGVPTLRSGTGVVNQNIVHTASGLLAAHTIVPIAGRHRPPQIRYSPTCRYSVTVAPAPLADALHDRYVLERELDPGGMATVTRQ